MTDRCPCKRRLGHRHTQREDHVKTEEEAIYEARREASEETSSVRTLISDFRPPGLRGNTFLPWMPPWSVALCYGGPGSLRPPGTPFRHSTQLLCKQR